MTHSTTRRAVAAGALLCCLGTALFAAGPASASPRTPFVPGDLLVSRLHYSGTSAPLIAGRTVLPTGAIAVAGSDFAHVWDNLTVDANFGVTAPVYLDQLTPSGRAVDTIPVSAAAQGRPSGADLLTGSFSSKSEGALNLSTNGGAVTFMGYAAPVGALDVSNDNTPGVVDPTNPDAQETYRAVGELDANGRLSVTETNAYSGDNGRAAILDNGTGEYFAAGNSNNGTGTSVPGVISGTGAQLIRPATAPERAQDPGQPTPAGGFSVTQLGVVKADKLGKDTNFTAVAVHDGVVYYAKGSGSNGVDTVYFIDTTGRACPKGVGTPVPGAPAPSAADAYDPTTGQPADDMCVLAGFPTALAKSITTPEVGGAQNTTAISGLWFADDTTLYVADAGNGTSTFDGTRYTAAAAQTLAGIQKWSLVDGMWRYDYTLQSGLRLGVPYDVRGLPGGINALTGTSWAPAVDGVHSLTGIVNRNGTVTLYGVTSSVGGLTDPGADPDKLVAITDAVGATIPGAHESFTTLRTAAAGDVYRGVSLAPTR